MNLIHLSVVDLNIVRVYFELLLKEIVFLNNFWYFAYSQCRIH